MADSTLAALTADTAPALTRLVYTTDATGSSGSDRKSTVGELLAMKPFIGVHAYRATTSQSVADSTNAAVQFNAEVFDTSSLHDNSTNNTRITIPSGLAGYWRFTAQVQFNANGTGYRQIRFYKNGAVTNGMSRSAPASAASDHQQQCGPFILSLVATDYVEVFVQQTSGGALDIEADLTWVQAEWLGA